MLTIFDRYLIGQFFWTWLVCFISLTGLYVMIDAFGNLDDFLAYAQRTETSPLAVMGEYYLFRSLAFFDRTSGILALVAAMFTLAGLQRHQELTAILAAGISPRRAISGLILMGGGLAIVAAAGREVVLPQYREKLTRTAQDLGGKTQRKLDPRPDYWSGIILRGRGLSLDSKEILEPNFSLPRAAAATWGRTLVARTASYEAGNADHPAGYRLKGVTQPAAIDKKPGWRLSSAEQVLWTAAEANWLAHDEAFVASEVAFELLVDPLSWRQYASTAELVAGLYRRGMDYGNDVRVGIHARLLQPALDVLLLLLGLPLLLRGQNRNVFLAVGWCVVVVIGFMVVVLGCQYLGSSYLISPSLGAWLPLLIFVPLTAYSGEALWE